MWDPLAGFTEIKETDPWAEKSMLKPGGKYFYTRAASTIVAFAIGAAFEAGNGFKVCLVCSKFQGDQRQAALSCSCCCFF